MIRTLVVEDDPAVAEINTGYLSRVPGFAPIGVARTGTGAIAAVTGQPVDLVLLDFYLPDMSGLQVCRALRGSHPDPVDIIAVTAARDAETVRTALAYGVVQYLIKPYRFATFQEKLERYAVYRSRLGASWITDQHEVDRTLETLRGSSASGVPKGLAPATYELVTDILRQARTPLSAREVAAAAGWAGTR